MARSPVQSGRHPGVRPGRPARLRPPARRGSDARFAALPSGSPPLGSCQPTRRQLSGAGPAQAQTANNRLRHNRPVFSSYWPASCSSSTPRTSSRRDDSHSRGVLGQAACSNATSEALRQFQRGRAATSEAASRPARERFPEAVRIRPPSENLCGGETPPSVRGEIRIIPNGRWRLSKRAGNPGCSLTGAAGCHPLTDSGADPARGCAACSGLSERVRLAG